MVPFSGKYTTKRENKRNKEKLVQNVSGGKSAWHPRFQVFLLCPPKPWKQEVCGAFRVVRIAFCRIDPLRLHMCTRAASTCRLSFDEGNPSRGRPSRTRGTGSSSAARHLCPAAGVSVLSHRSSAQQTRVRRFLPPFHCYFTIS